MAMLAEPKRKIKWSLNPRGNFWAKDDTKFGQKLLEKMGWQKGKGLGRLENGCVDNVKAVFKNNNTGIGWNNSQHVVPHNEEYSSLLSSLKHIENGSVKKTSKASSEQVSLENRSKSFKSRMHYQKFVRGKDVSRYSEKDKECIFGKKSSQTENVIDLGIACLV